MITGSVTPLSLSAGLDLEAVHSGHADVEQDAAGLEVGRSLQQLDAALVGAHMKARRLEHEPDRAADRLVVVDQMDQTQLAIIHVFASPLGRVK